MITESPVRSTILSSQLTPEPPLKWRCYALVNLDRGCSICPAIISKLVIKQEPDITQLGRTARLTYPKTYSKDIAEDLADKAAHLNSVMCAEAKHTTFSFEPVPTN